MQNLECYLIKKKIDFESSVSLKKKTWIKRGGIARFWILPNTIKELHNICLYCYTNKLYFEIVGHTSNLYFDNNYNPNIVISTIRLTNYIINNGEIECEPGVSIAKLSNQCVQLGIVGYEGLIGLPGTVASSVYNNSSCFECSMSEIFIKAKLLQTDGSIKELFLSDLKYSKRSSSLKRKELQGVILSVVLRSDVTGDKAKLKSIALRNKEMRKKSQEGPLNNLGSVFGTIIGYKKTPRNFILKCLLKIIFLFIQAPVNRNKYIKKNILIFYGRRDLFNYISDYNINCFIWKDDNADKYFKKYVNLLKSVFYMEKDQLEIEVRTNKKTKKYF